MSGGVDSSATAGLLGQQGYEVSGLFMQLGQSRSSDSDQDIAEADAREVADKLGIELIVVDYRSEIEKVIEYFVSEYRAGRTPNPCVMCNRRLKFGKIVDFAMDKGFDYVATGHYARVEDGVNGKRLRRGADMGKDQSYSLFGMGSERLQRVMLPTGGYNKTEIRQIAKDMGLPVHAKSDSMEICFVPNDDYIALLAERAPELDRPGKVIDSTGKVLGEHSGIHRFTIGQRKGLGIPLGEPAYVIKLDAETNTVVLGNKDQAHSRELLASDMVWLTPGPPREPFRSLVQIRYNNRPGKPGMIIPIWEGDEYTGKMKVEFEEPILAVTPGQAAVVYDGEYVMGGGWIK